MIELMLAIMMLNVGILAIMGAFNSSAVAMARASRTATATTLGEKQMELYRAQIYSNVALDAGATNLAESNATYNSDTAYNALQQEKTCAGTPSAVAPQCNPMRSVTGPDGRSYRIDTYIVHYTPNFGRAVKKVTVVVRQTSPLKTLARLSSTFDQSTG